MSQKIKKGEKETPNGGHDKIKKFKSRKIKSELNILGQQIPTNTRNSKLLSAYFHNNLKVYQTEVGKCKEFDIHSVVPNNSRSSVIDTSPNAPNNLVNQNTEILNNLTKCSVPPRESVEQTDKEIIRDCNYLEDIASYNETTRQQDPAPTQQVFTNEQSEQKTDLDKSLRPSIANERISVIAPSRPESMRQSANRFSIISEGKNIRRVSRPDKRLCNSRGCPRTSRLVPQSITTKKRSLGSAELNKSLRPPSIMKSSISQPKSSYSIPKEPELTNNLPAANFIDIPSHARTEINEIHSNNSSLRQHPLLLATIGPGRISTVIPFENPNKFASRDTVQEVHSDLDKVSSSKKESKKNKKKNIVKKGMHQEKKENRFQHYVQRPRKIRREILIDKVCNELRNDPLRVDYCVELLRTELKLLKKKVKSLAQRQLHQHKRQTDPELITTYIAVESVKKSMDLLKELLLQRHLIQAKEEEQSKTEQFRKEDEVRRIRAENIVIHEESIREAREFRNQGQRTGRCNCNCSNYCYKQESPSYGVWYS